MATTAGHFTDAPVFIYDKNNKLVTQTAITGHNTKEMYIEVSEGLEKIEPRTRLQLLIIHANGASEVSGILKESTRPGVYEILIYDEHSRDLRVSVRRTINTSAVISDMVVDSNAKELTAPLPVIIENMSTTGILIKSSGLRIELGALLQIELNVEKKIGILYCEVLREKKHPGNEYSYGCQLYFF